MDQTELILNQTQQSNPKQSPNSNKPLLILKQLRIFKARTIVPILCLLILTIFYHIHYSSILTSEIYSQPLYTQNLTTTQHSSRYYTNFEHYLKQNYIKSVLEVACNIQCMIESDWVARQGIKVGYIYGISDIRVHNASQVGLRSTDNIIGYWDWIKINEVNFDSHQLQKAMETIKRITRVGISLSWPIAQYYSQPPTHLQSLLKVLESHGFAYNHITSLQLRRSESKVINIFTREMHIIQINSHGQGNNYLGVHVEVKLKDDLPYLREWIGFHVGIGVDKFFVYVRGVGQETGCLDAPERVVAKQWQKILVDYHSYIVQIPWNPQPPTIPFPFSWIYQSVPKSEHDYLINFKNAVKYTIFLKPYELIYSELGLNLNREIANYDKNKIFDCFSMKIRYFGHRYCNREKYMISNMGYYASAGDKEYRQVFKTSQFITGFRIQQYLKYIFPWNWYKLVSSSAKYTPEKIGHPSQKNQLKFGPNIWRIHSYSLTASRQQALQGKSGRYPNLYLSYDYSIQSKIVIAKDVCKYKCYLGVREECRRGFWEMEVKGGDGECVKEFQRVKLKP